MTVYQGVQWPSLTSKNILSFLQQNKKLTGLCLCDLHNQQRDMANAVRKTVVWAYYKYTVKILHKQG